MQPTSTMWLMISNIFKLKVNPLRRNAITPFVQLLRVQLLLKTLLYKLLGKHSTWATAAAMFYKGTQVISTLIYI